MSKAIEHFAEVRRLLADLDEETVDGVRSAEGHLRVCVAHLSALAGDVVAQSKQDDPPSPAAAAKPRAAGKKA